jgi:hypothetical protein
MRNDLKCANGCKSASLVCLDSDCKLSIFCDGCSEEHAKLHKSATTVLSIQSLLSKDSIDSWFDSITFKPQVSENSLWKRHREFCLYMMNMITEIDVFIKEKLRRESKEFMLAEKTAQVKNCFQSYENCSEEKGSGQAFLEYAKEYQTLIQLSRSKQIDSSEKKLEEINSFYGDIKEKLDSLFNDLLCPKSKSSDLKIKHKSGLLKDSMILTSADQREFVIGKMFSDRANYRLLYRASENEFKSSRFHEFCDHRGPTVTLVKVNNKIFGAYTDLSWASESGYQTSTESFLFSVDKNLQFHLKDPRKAVYHSKEYGPTFGAGHDLALSDNCGHNLSSWSSLNFSYAVSDHLSGEASKLLAGSSSFQVTEYEVYQVIFD